MHTLIINKEFTHEWFLYLQREFARWRNDDGLGMLDVNVKTLQNGNRERRCLPCPGLRLRDDIMPWIMLACVR